MAKCLKYLMVAFNFVFFILGLLLMGIGGYSRVKTADYSSVLGESGSMMSAANLLIAAGVFVAIIGFVGCCGAWKENTVMLGIYAALVILIFILEIAGGAIAYTKKDEVLGHFEEQLDDIVYKEYTMNPTPAQAPFIKGINWFQQNVQCCGIRSANDWSNSEWFKQQAAPNRTLKVFEIVPESCCKEMSRGCSHVKDPNVAATNSSVEIWEEGCFSAGKVFVKEKMWLLGGAGVGVAVIQLLGVVFAILQIRDIKQDKDIA